MFVSMCSADATVLQAQPVIHWRLKQNNNFMRLRLLPIEPFTWNFQKKTTFIKSMIIDYWRIIKMEFLAE